MGSDQGRCPEGGVIFSGGVLRVCGVKVQDGAAKMLQGMWPPPCW